MGWEEAEEGGDVGKGREGVKGVGKRRKGAGGVTTRISEDWQAKWDKRDEIRETR